MHRRTFLQSLCVLAAAAAIGHVPARAPGLGDWIVEIVHGPCYVQGRHDGMIEAAMMAQRHYNRIQSDILQVICLRSEHF